MRPFIFLSPIEERINGEGLVIDSVPLSKIIEINKFPVYVTSLNSISQRIHFYKQELNLFFEKNEIFYAMKANFSSVILNEVVDNGIGVDIVSIGEWEAAVNAGFSSEKICFAGSGKKESEWMKAIRGGLGYLSVEHLSELNDILSFLSQEREYLKIQTKILLRLNPEVEVDTHPHLKTGSLNSKFGIIFSHFEKWLIDKKLEFNNSDDFYNWIYPLKGIHVHVGSQLLENNSLSLIIKKILDCAQFMLMQGIIVKYINFGGGLGVPYEGVPLNGEDIKNYINLLSTSFIKISENYQDLMVEWGERFSGLLISIEPGRSIVASSTLFLTQVLYEKKNSSINLFCYVDGGMNDFPRPSMYGALHNAEVVNFTDLLNLKERLSLNYLKWSIVGPVCESGDFLSKSSILPQVKKGDIIAFFEAGAYCRAMANNYNLRPLPSEIFLKDGKIIKVT